MDQQSKSSTKLWEMIFPCTVMASGKSIIFLMKSIMEVGPEPCSAHERKLEGPTKDQTLSTEGTWHVFWFSVQCNTGNMGYGQLDTWPARVKYFFRNKNYIHKFFDMFLLLIFLKWNSKILCVYIYIYN